MGKSLEKICNECKGRGKINQTVNKHRLRINCVNCLGLGVIYQ